MTIQKYTKDIVVKKCIHSCPFYFSSMEGMECGHPYFNNKDSYDRMIITRGDIIPRKCPLRNGTTVLTEIFNLTE